MTNPADVSLEVTLLLSVLTGDERYIRMAWSNWLFTGQVFAIAELRLKPRLEDKRDDI